MDIKSGTSKACAVIVPWLDENTVHIRPLPNGQTALIVRFLFTHAIVYDLDAYGYTVRWCYPDLGAAYAALNQWEQNLETQIEPLDYTRRLGVPPKG